VSDEGVLRIPADVNELAAIRQFVRDHAVRAGADPQQTSDLVQAVDESATNSILHGYRGAEGQVEVEIDVLENDLVVRVRDQAPAFDPTEVPSPDVTLPLEDRPFHGLGVFLARELADEVTYRHTNKGNELTLVKAIHSRGR
jgi:serine/threonine-protein kinase RsbW